MRLIPFLLLALFISSCRSGNSNPTPSAQAITPVTATNRPLVPSTTSTRPVVPSPTQTPTQIQHVSATHTSTALPPLPTWTPLPTLEFEDAQVRNFELIQDTSMCELPCWWGFVPGVTKWLEARQVLARSADNISIVNRVGEDFTAIVRLFVPGEDTPRALNHEFRIRGGVVEEIALFNADLVPSHTLVQILGRYGAPDEVQIRTFSTSFQGQLPFGVALFYSSLGIMVEYYPPGAIVNDQIVGCPQDTKHPFVSLWSPSSRLTFLEATRHFSAEAESWPFLSLVEATGQSVNTFNEIFSDPSNEQCLASPLDLWTSQ